MYKKASLRRGYTIAEVIAVVGIIAVLSSVIYIGGSESRKEARDRQRESDLSQVQLALRLYYERYGTYKVADTGWLNNGNGWFDETCCGAVKTLSQALYDEGLLSDPDIDDPTTPGAGGYMIYLCEHAGGDVYNAYSLSATKEKPVPEEIAYTETLCNGTGVNGIVPIYGKNYGVGNKTYSP